VTPFELGIRDAFVKSASAGSLGGLLGHVGGGAALGGLYGAATYDPKKHVGSRLHHAGDTARGGAFGAGTMYALKKGLAP
jgi:hypothetical protein